MRLCMSELDTPLGAITLVWDGEGSLCALEYQDCHERMRRLLGIRYGSGLELVPAGLPRPIALALGSYFSGELEAINMLPVSSRGTPFQQSVWRALREIPAGGTASYGQLAGRLGKPGAARAVGMANNVNAVAIVVPCHRVIGADGSLTGYAGGLERKRWLLGHERRHARD